MDPPQQASLGISKTFSLPDPGKKKKTKNLRSLSHNQPHRASFSKKPCWVTQQPLYAGVSLNTLYEHTIAQCILGVHHFFICSFFVFQDLVPVSSPQKTIDWGGLP